MDQEAPVIIDSARTVVNGVSLTMNEYMLRRMLAYRCGKTVYRRDGELVCDRHLPHIDFLRDTPGVIANKLMERTASEDAKELAKNPLLRINYIDFGMGFHHNMPCAVLSGTEHAVIDCATGAFHPSWKAQESGWRLIRATSRFQKWLLRFFNTLR